MEHSWKALVHDGVCIVTSSLYISYLHNLWIWVHLWQLSLDFRTRCRFTGQVFTQTDSSSSWARLYSKRFIVSPTQCLYNVYEFPFFLILSQCVLALRGASSRRKRNSLNAAKSASQEILSPQRDERNEEKRAQSMDNLDGNGKLQLTHYRSHGRQYLCQFRILVYSCVWFSICFLQSCTVPPSNQICCQELLCHLSPAETMKRTSTTGTLSAQHSDL